RDLAGPLSVAAGRALKSQRLFDSEPLVEARRGPGIDDLRRVDAGALDLAGSMFDAAELVLVMSIAGQHERHAALPRRTQRLHREVEALEGAVDLQRRASAFRRSEHGLEIELDARTAANVAGCQVADHAHARVLHGAHDALGLCRPLELEVRVYRGQAEGKGSAKLGVVVELPRR